MTRKKKLEDTELEKDIIGIKEILKKIQEDTNRLENNFSYYSNKEYGPVANNYLPSIQACSEEEISRQHEFNYK